MLFRRTLPHSLKILAQTLWCQVEDASSLYFIAVLFFVSILIVRYYLHLFAYKLAHTPCIN
jgi:hypothetical protein